MDPNAALINLRAAINAALIEQSPDHDSVDAIAEHFEALDGWLSRGGFLPEAWRPEQYANFERDLLADET